jgi:hypothetical protein
VCVCEIGSDAYVRVLIWVREYICMYACALECACMRVGVCLYPNTCLSRRLLDASH